MWRVAVVAAEAHADAFEAALGEGASALSRFRTVSAGGAWRIGALTPDAPDLAALGARLALAAAALGVAAPEIAVEAVPESDWVAESRALSPPVRAGRYVVRGAHVAPARCGAIEIEIDAGPAFGAGEHESTRGCLLALDALARRRRPRRALDMGCGSGLLAIAIAKTWGASTLAADVDDRAVRTARDNARRNGVAPLVRAVTSDGYNSIAVRRAAPYDLIVANILAGALIRMAPDLARSLAPGGAAVLSGLLGRQEFSVLAAHRAQGLGLARRIALGSWRTLVLEHRAAPADT